MNTRQKTILKSWSHLLRHFANREWFSLFMSSGLGVLAAEAVHLLWLDHSFQSFLISRYEPSVSPDDPRYYVPYLAIVLLLLYLAVVAFVYRYIWRGVNSRWAGVTSGLVVMPFLSALLFSLLPYWQFHHRLILGFAAAGVWFLLSFVLYIAAKPRAERTVREDELRVPLGVRSLAGSRLSESDDPIEFWEQDALGRAGLVDSLSVKIMIAKAPVLALDGAFGSDKSSTLNLLREHLADHAITISFSTWLPGSQVTLTSYLLADIANECNKQYVVPGLRQSARRLATALGRKVPFLSDYLKLLPAATQKDDIEKLKSALLRLPKRVVVLLDELDRMEKEELITLLKVIRGIATLPNLCFVCAGSLETMVKISEKDYEYFEKFFPVIISIPEPDPAALRRMGSDRVVAAFVGRDWFEDSNEADQFKKQLEAVWDRRIAPYCRNLRAIGLLANDVSVAAAPLRREVDPLDLTLIEMLRRFEPLVYRLVAKNSFALTGGETLVRGGAFHEDKDEEEAKKRFLDSLREMVPDTDEFDRVRGVINELFPLSSKPERRLRREQRSSEKSKIQEKDKRIREPGIFPAYFRYELPSEIFSSVELALLLRQLEQASTQEARDLIFLNTLQSMEKGSLKRDDFLRKLADAASSISIPVAKSAGLTAVRVAAQYTYDMMAPFAEAGHVLRMILLIAQRLPQTDRVAFLQACISNTNDDTMAFRILTVLTRQEGESNIGVSVADLYPSFAKRMRMRYGRDVDAANFDLSASDSWALEYWGRDLSGSGITTDPEDRQIQNEFWLRYIGNSRSRLAKAFREFFLPIAAYSEDPTSLIQHRISVDDLKRLYKELPEDPTLTSADLKSLEILRRFLDGEFKNGISPVSGIR